MMNYREYRKFMHKMLNTKLSCGKSFLELTEYSDIALWFCADFYFHHFINKNMTTYFNNKLNYKILLAKIYKEFNFFLNWSTKSLVKTIDVCKFSNKDTKKTKRKIIFTALDIEWREIKDHKTNCTIKSDAFFNSIVNKLRYNKNNLLGIYPIINANSYRIYIEKIKKWDIPHKPFNFYWDPCIRNEVKKSYDDFENALKIIKNDESFHKLCSYKGRNLSNEIIKQLELYFYYLFPQSVNQIEIAKQMIDIEKPDIILMQNEYGHFERALIIAAKLKQIPTLAIQHGIITPTHPGYIFNKEDKDKIILPDITCVYGQYYYDLLIKNSIYEPEQVIVTGQPRYDILHNIDKIYSKKKYLEKYGIDPEHKIVLWTTQSHGLSDEENVRNLMAIFETMKKLKNTTLIIKQHPGERKKDTKLIKQYLNAYKINALLMDKKSNTYEQLFVCDLMITKHSTTAMEAVALNKPVIVLSLYDGTDYAGYVEEGVAYGVYNEEYLTTTIEELLQDDSHLAENRDEYIMKYVYKRDGEATERVIDVIENMLL